MKKNVYETPVVEVIAFAVEDVITTSREDELPLKPVT